MPEEIQRSRGRPSNYRQDRGGVPAEYGPFVGVVMNNVDVTRNGRLQVFIEVFAAGDMNDDSKWTTVSYLPHFYGATPPGNTGTANDGQYPGNQNSYGMWFTPPDLGVKVICIFANGDRSQGYYIGVIPENSLNHMIPAIGAEGNYIPGNENQTVYFKNAPLMPVTEINTANERLDNAGRFFEQAKPIQSVVASAMFQQGLARDIERGPIRSSAQRESPSACFGFSTPGVAIYQGGLTPREIRAQLNSGTVQPADLRVIGRMGGHTLVMDDGDIDGTNSLFRLRTAKGHQITMNDSGNFLYIIHANGQTWIELGVEGTVDIFSTNSVNVRTQGDVNLHADRDINMWAGRDFNVKAVGNVIMEAGVNCNITATDDFKIYSKATLGVRADGTLALQSKGGSWNAGPSMKVTAGMIDLNGPRAPTVERPVPLKKTKLDETEFNAATGWEVKTEKLESIVPRAPTHEPWPYHNQGVDVDVSLQQSGNQAPPGSSPIPAGVNISRS